MCVASDSTFRIGSNFEYKLAWQHSFYLCIDIVIIVGFNCTMDDILPSNSMTIKI